MNNRCRKHSCNGCVNRVCAYCRQWACSTVDVALSHGRRIVLAAGTCQHSAGEQYAANDGCAHHDCRFRGRT